MLGQLIKKDLKDAGQSRARINPKRLNHPNPDLIDGVTVAASDRWQQLSWRFERLVSFKFGERICSGGTTCVRHIEDPFCA
jgi:hypothetical protein